MKRTKFLLTLTRIALILSVLAIDGWAIVIFSRTLVSPYLPIIIGAAVALLSMPLCLKLWRKVASSYMQWVNILCHTAAAFSVGTFLMLALNYYMPQAGSNHSEQAEIVSKYSKKRHKTRRVGRRYVTSSETYTTYYALLRFPDGHTKEITLSLSEYNRTRTGSTRTYTVSTGLFGIPIFSR